MKYGDIIVLYRTAEDGRSAEYSAVATSICVIEEVRKQSDFGSFNEFFTYANQYSVFDRDDLYKWYQRGECKAIKMTYNVALKKRIVRHDLIEKIGLDRHEYWGFMQLTNAQFEEIIYAGGVSSESIIQNVCSQIVAFENEILYDECRLFRKRWMYMCAILLSINPKYVRRIMCGEKKYEFRKNLCKKKVDKIIIYSTSPVMKVVGEAVVEDVLVDEPFKIWNMTKEVAGVDQSFFDSYYEGKTKAVAYKLNHVVEYKIPKLLQDYGINVAPQSFCYLE